jgi:cysteinyl-tRNA synthetase
MDDDFNSAAAVAVLFEAAKESNRWLDEARAQAASAARIAELLRELGGVLGLFAVAPAEFLQGAGGAGELSEAEIEALIAERSAARAAKDWAAADRVRDQLAAAGIILKDSPDGTRWQRKRG